MSRIYFHSPTEEVEVYGSERAWLGQPRDERPYPVGCWASGMKYARARRAVEALMEPVE